MRTTLPALLACFLLAGLLVLAGTRRALAEDEPLSPAEQAFEDAFWAETSTTALDHALKAYRAAADAEGPVEVRARALYRAAVVLERMGRTDEGIQSLERLGQEFPDQSEILAKARERLAEWTAVDLRTSFDEWYQRYLYSPEFQARVVRLVLQLASVGNAESQAVLNELLTIGEPAVPALKAHADTPDARFQERVVTLLLRLGAVPTADQLAATSGWRRNEAAWHALFALSSDERATLRSKLPDDAWEPLRLALGPASDWSRAVVGSGSNDALRAALEAAPDDEVGLALLQSLGESTQPGFGQIIASELRARGLVDDEQILAWLQSPSRDLRMFAVDAIARAQVDRPGILRAVAEGLAAPTARKGAPNAGRQDYLRFVQALAAAYTETSTRADRRAAVRALDATWSSHGGLQPGALFNWDRRLGDTPPALTKAKAQRLYEDVVEHAQEPDLVKWAMREWARETDPGLPKVLRLLAWAKAPAERPERAFAAREAYRDVTNESLDVLLEALATLPDDVTEAAWRGFGARGNMLKLDWTDERLETLMRRGHGVGSFADKVVAWILTGGHMPQLARIALEAPGVVLPSVLGLVPDEKRCSDAVLDIVREGYPRRWAAWDWAERAAAFRILSYLRRRGDAAEGSPLVAFLRTEARAAWETPASETVREQQRTVRLALLAALPSLALDDVVHAFDVSTPAGAADAVSALDRRGATPTAEAYERLGAFRQHTEVKQREGAYEWWMEADADLLRRVRTDQLEDPSPRLRRGALNWLAKFRDPRDIPMLVKALDDPDTEVRLQAATWLGKNYDESAIDALVKALDDPAPHVRDAALASLEDIKAIEEKKAWWRERAR